MADACLSHAGPLFWPRCERHGDYTRNLVETGPGMPVVPQGNGDGRMGPDFICEICNQKTPEYHYGGKCAECHEIGCASCIFQCPKCGRSICRKCSDRTSDDSCANQSACDMAKEIREIRKVLYHRSTGKHDRTGPGEAAVEEILKKYAICPNCNAVALKSELCECMRCGKFICTNCNAICDKCRQIYCRFCFGIIHRCCMGPYDSKRD